MTFGSAALRARPEGFLELLPPLPVDILEAAFRVEIALARGPQTQVVANESDLVVGDLPCKPAWRKPVNGSGRLNTHIRAFDKSGAIDFVAEALRRAPAKQIAKDAKASPRTVEKWKGRLVAPQLHNFLNACQKVPELKAAMRQLLAMDGEANPNFQRAIADLVRAIKP